MNTKEISEIKKTLSPDRSTIASVCGCYVNASGEIIAKFSRPLGLMGEDEAEKYLFIFKKTISGSLSKNLFNMDFSTAQVSGGEEYKLLSRLRTSELGDEEALDAFYALIAKSVAMKDNYVILLAYAKYDVPFKHIDGNTLADDSSEIFSHIFCSVCPVKASKASLTYDPDEKLFRNNAGASAVSAPEMGFMFPAFDCSRTNIYGALFYTRTTKDTHSDFTGAVFGNDIPMPADAQEESFRALISETLADACDLTAIKEMRRQIEEKIEEHKASGEEEPLTLDGGAIKEILANCGASEEGLAAFSESFKENFGEMTELDPKNLINTKKFELRTPDVVIKVAPDKPELVQTKVIGGAKFIMIRADEGVELNGLNMLIEE